MWLIAAYPHAERNDQWSPNLLAVHVGRSHTLLSSPNDIRELLRCDASNCRQGTDFIKYIGSSVVVPRNERRKIALVYFSGMN